MSKKELVFQGALIGLDNPKKPLAVSMSPIEIDLDDNTRKIRNDIEDAVVHNTSDLAFALKKLNNIPDSSQSVSAMMMLEIYQAFESGQFALISSSRYPCEDGSGDHCLTIRFKPPAS